MIIKSHYPMYRYLMILTIASTVGLQAWRTLFDNFAVHVCHLEGFHIGVLQSVREIPGFLALLAIYLLFIIKEHRLSALSVLILGVGVCSTGFFPSWIGLIFTTLIMSFGFHYFETTNQSLTLQYFDNKTSPWILGKLRSFAAASNIVAGIAIFIVAPYLDFYEIYMILGGLVILAGIWAFFQDPVDKTLIPQHKRMIFRKRYFLFYFLTLMAGARRQIFVAFAVFLMVRQFEYSVQLISVLFVVNNVINYFVSPFIGKSIIRFGERKVLTLEYFSLLFIFVAYATVNQAWLVAILYILDHIFFNFAIAIRTYYQKIADPQDIAPGMAVGFTINHIAAVVIPTIGGMLWMIDYRIPFICGAAMSFISLCAVQWINTPEQTQ
ncbi:MAG: MFS transporter [Candidatus Magnetomorum sp.]|nr:MFS transporter [Candidatus Magnetomorum sp.]